MTRLAIDRNGRRLQKIRIRVIGWVFSLTIVSQQLCCTWNIDRGGFIRKCGALSNVTRNIWTVASKLCVKSVISAKERELLLWVCFRLGLQQAWFRNGNTFRAALRSGPSGQLSGAPAYKGRKDVSEIIASVVPVNSVFHTRKKKKIPKIRHLGTRPWKGSPALL
jgi:hypothetical protein